MDPVSSTTIGPITILLVEDHTDTARSLAKLLAHYGHTVSIASTAADARRLAAASRFELVLCDLGLPDGDGADLLAEIQAMYPVAGVAISGYGMEQDVARSLDAGFTTHLLKPCGLERLMQAIEQAVVRAPAGAAARSRN